VNYSFKDFSKSSGLLGFIIIRQNVFYMYIFFLFELF